MGFDEKLKKYQKQNPESRIKAPFCIFHTFEFFLFGTIISFFFYQFIFIMIGLLFHSMLDFIEMHSKGIVDVREYSLVLYFLRKNKKGWIYL
jgi:hypothetical protein